MLRRYREIFPIEKEALTFSTSRKWMKSNIDINYVAVVNIYILFLSENIADLDAIL